MMARMRGHRKEFLEKRAAMKAEEIEKRRQNKGAGRKRSQENLRKMDEYRDKIKLREKR